jgi:glycerol-3-phosphate dehydrogenase
MRLSEDGVFDVLVIDGGINGCGVARDAAGRGLRICLVEMDDLASGTSSRSTELIHGGLRYLEHYEFRLVREALRERELLRRSAPHIIHPMRFVLSDRKHLRPEWLLRSGLFLYDHIGGREALPKTSTVDLRSDPIGTVLAPGFTMAFEFSDCCVDDARLVVPNARDAVDRHAAIRTRTKAVGAWREGGLWRIVVEDRHTGTRDTVVARLLVNAAGPRVQEIVNMAGGGAGARSVRLVRGSHIVVPRRSADARAFFLQAPDRRIVFAIPHEESFTMIGTTDTDHVGDPGATAPTEAEIACLCRTASDYLAGPVHSEDVVWAFSGVRPLYHDGAPGRRRRRGSMLSGAPVHRRSSMSSGASSRPVAGWRRPYCASSRSGSDAAIRAGRIRHTCPAATLRRAVSTHRSNSSKGVALACRNTRRAAGASVWYAGEGGCRHDREPALRGRSA